MTYSRSLYKLVPNISGKTGLPIPQGQDMKACCQLAIKGADSSIHSTVCVLGEGINESIREESVMGKVMSAQG